MKRIGRVLLGDYEIYRIYRRDLQSGPPSESPGVRLGTLDTIDPVAGSDDPQIRGQVVYAGPDAFVFGAWLGAELAALCWYWGPERYREQRNFWPLARDQVKLIQITTDQRYRGRGIGLALLRYTESQMAARGFRTAFARVWHSNEPSVRIFRAAGWREVAWVVVVRPLGIRVRATWPVRGTRQDPSPRPPSRPRL